MWWTPAHDELLAQRIGTLSRHWHHKIHEDIVGITPPDKIEEWKTVDPLCQRFAWYNILWNFAAARADEIGLTKLAKEPEWKVCPLCENKFLCDSLRHTLVKRLGVNQIDFCGVCLDEVSLFPTSTPRIPYTGEEILTYLRDLANLLGKVPHQDYGAGERDLMGLSTAERLLLLKLLRTRPSVGQVKEHHESWFNALIQAGILEGSAQRTTRGTRCLATDGHMCLSLAEKTIDDFLYSHGVAHEKEPPYPEGNYRGDFQVGSIFIEYFGLTGNPDYDAKTALKQEILKKHKIQLIPIFPFDVVSDSILREKLKPLL